MSDQQHGVTPLGFHTSTSRVSQKVPGSKISLRSKTGPAHTHQAPRGLSAWMLLAKPQERGGGGWYPTNPPTAGRSPPLLGWSPRASLLHANERSITLPAHAAAYSVHYWLIASIKAPIT